LDPRRTTWEWREANADAVQVSLGEEGRDAIVRSGEETGGRWDLEWDCAGIARRS
jgi:hypothetical protein